MREHVSSIGRSGRDKVGERSEMVDEHEDGVEAAGLGKFDNVVHADNFPGPSGDRQRLQMTVGRMTRGLVALTGVAGGAEEANEAMDTGETVVSME